MVIGKIIYDNTLRTRDEWEQELFSLSIGFPDVNMPDLGDLPEFEGGVQSHYFAIFSNHPKVIEQGIRNQIKEKLGRWVPIAWEGIFDPTEKTEFYRIDSPKEIILYRKPIYDVQSRWIKDKTLHTKKPKAIRNLIKRLEAGE